jgi:hypothetical protein
MVLHKVAPAPLRVVADTAPQAALLAQLAQGLTRTLMRGVHEAAGLNVATVQALLAPSDGSVNGELQRLVESWRFSWRAFEICATTAANVLRLTGAHGQAGVDALERLFERHVEGLPQWHREQAATLRDALQALRAAQAGYFEAAVEVHRSLIALAGGAR